MLKSIAGPNRIKPVNSNTVMLNTLPKSNYLVILFQFQNNSFYDDNSHHVAELDFDVLTVLIRELNKV